MKRRRRQPSARDREQIEMAQAKALSVFHYYLGGAWQARVNAMINHRGRSDIASWYELLRYEHFNDSANAAYAWYERETQSWIKSHATS